MKNILARDGMAMLESFAWSNVLVGLDYDGTLAPIANDPARAVMRAGTRVLLREVARLYPTAIISGRSRRDLSRMLAGVAVFALVGNHGIEASSTEATATREVRAWRARLEAALGALPGVVIEEKAHSVAVHYRRCRAKKLARAEISLVTQSLSGVRIIAGKQIVDILPKEAPHKGLALERERDRAGCHTAIYLGDDQTDEDVFALEQPGRLLGIRVGNRVSSLASYFLPRQTDVDTLLKKLIEVRQTSGRPARAQGPPARSTRSAPPRVTSR